MKKVRIAQIGTSAYSHGQSIFESIKKQSDVFETVGFALPENEREKFPKQCAVFNGYREMTVDEILNDRTIDAVTVETEEKHITKYALLAAESGKHIHCEKPGGTVLKDFEKLISTAKSNGIVFHTGYMYRYNPEVIKLKEKIKNGELGEIISVEAQMNCLESAPLREWLGNYPGGMMFFLGCHLVDLVLQLKGTPKKIIPFNRATGLGDISSTDFAMAVFDYGNGCSFVKTCGVEVGGFARRQLVVTGSKATVELKPLEMFCDGGLFTETCSYNNSSWGDRGISNRTKTYDRYDSMMRAFATYITDPNVKNPYTPDYELQLYKTLLECCR